MPNPTTLLCPLLLILLTLFTFFPSPIHPFPTTTDLSILLHPRQAGLTWGPITVSNLKLTLTNPHIGYAGPKFPSAEHVNFHVDRADPGPRGTFSPVVNMHTVKYARVDPAAVEGGQEGACLYAWDSVTREVVFDQCDDDVGEAVVRQAAVAIKGFVDALVKNANVIGRVAIGIALVAALVAVLGSLPVVAFA